jgi:hypothetical protein
VRATEKARDLTMTHFARVLGLASAALLIQAGSWIATLVHESPGALRARLSGRGAEAARTMLANGRSAIVVSKWIYRDAEDWWRRFCNVNFTGWQRPDVPPPPTPLGPPGPPHAPPIERIAGLVSVACDAVAAGKGDSHVVIRYLPEANVQPPEDYLSLPVTSVLSAPTGSARPGGSNRRSDPVPPTAPAVREYLQFLRIGDPLWPPYGDVTLVEVGPHADQAWFVRTPPDDAGQRMQLSMSTTPMRAKTRAQLDRMRQYGVVDGGAPPDAPHILAAWAEVDETTRIDGTFHIGRNDVASLDDDSSRGHFLERVNLDPWQSRVDSSVRGVQVRTVDPQLGQSYGVQAGDVLKSINDYPVRNKADVLTALRRQYNLGTRTFHTRWLSATGQEVERIYQAPPGTNHH